MPNEKRSRRSSGKARSKRSPRKGGARPRERFTSGEERAARSARISIAEAQPYGWYAISESEPEKKYFLSWDPVNVRLHCSCPDFAFRARKPGPIECKHTHATYKHIGRCYLRDRYDPQAQAASYATGDRDRTGANS